MRDLFDGQPMSKSVTEHMAEGAAPLRGFADPAVPDLLEALEPILAAAPCRHLATPGGFAMSVAMTNCGAADWVSDRTDYPYDGIDPETGLPWPAMPTCFADLADTAAATAEFPSFRPDACLINRHVPGARLSHHQDRDERDMARRIAPVSPGLPATFLLGGLRRGDPIRKFALRHGDVAVWGGPSRLRFHGVSEPKDGNHPMLGGQRINLTFRGTL